MSDYTPSAAFRLANEIITHLVRWGLPIGVSRAPMALLTVPGRKTGLPRTTPVALAQREDGWLLVAVYGISDWSRNLEAAGHGTITIRGRDVAVDARRLPPAEGGPVLRDLILDAPRMIQRMTFPYFHATADAGIEEWERESVAHPVFALAEARP